MNEGDQEKYTFEVGVRALSFYHDNIDELEAMQVLKFTPPPEAQGKGEWTFRDVVYYLYSIMKSMDIPEEIQNAWAM